MPIKTFDSLQALAEWYDSEVFRDTLDDSLLVHNATEHVWYRYQWSPGHREIAFVDEHSGELPLVVQVYPPL